MSETFDPYYQWLGIPPEEQPANHYQLLGIKWFEDNMDVISAAFDRQMLHLRTYQIGDYSDLSQKLMNEMVSAKLCLQDPGRKAEYDQKLLEGDLATSIETQKTAGTAFGPQLEALFDEAEQAEPREILHRPRSKRWKPSSRQIKMAVLLSAGVVLIVVLIFAVGWLADKIQVAFEAVRQPAPVPAVPDDVNTPQPVAPQPIPKKEDQLPKPQTPDIDPAQVDSSKTEPPKPAPETQAKMPDTSTQPDKQPSATSGGTKPAATPAAGKLPVPPEDVRREASLKVYETFGISQDLAPLAKARLAKRLLESSGMGNAARDPAVRYEMLETASILAADCGDFILAFATIDKINEQYEIDPMAAKVSRLASAAASAKGPVQTRQVIKVANNLADRAVELKRFDMAERIMDVAMRACQRPDGKPMRKGVVNHRKEIRKRQQLYETIRQVEKTLESSPDDPKANLLMGTYLCLDENNWAAGLPLLAKGGEENIAKLARRELETPPQNVKEEIALADAWWTQASKTFGPRKRPILLRAAHWYRRAQPKLTIGIQTKHVDKRLETITRLTEPKSE